VLRECESAFSFTPLPTKFFRHRASCDKISCVGAHTSLNPHGLPSGVLFYFIFSRPRTPLYRNSAELRYKGVGCYVRLDGEIESIWYFLCHFCLNFDNIYT